MININADTYVESCIDTWRVGQKDNKSILWMKTHVIQDNLGFKNMYDLTVKEIKGIHKTKTPTK